MSIPRTRFTESRDKEKRATIKASMRVTRYEYNQLVEKYEEEKYAGETFPHWIESKFEDAIYHMMIRDDEPEEGNG